MEDLVLVITLWAVASPSTKLLVAQGAFFECLRCVRTTRAMFAHAGAQSFFCVEASTRLRRANARGHFSACLG